MSDLFQPVHEDFRRSFREFVENELLPNADAWEEAEDFPYEYFKKMGDLGFLGMRFPEEFGETMTSWPRPSCTRRSRVAIRAAWRRP